MSHCLRASELTAITRPRDYQLGQSPAPATMPRTRRDRVAKLDPSEKAAMNLPRSFIGDVSFQSMTEHFRSARRAFSTTLQTFCFFTSDDALCYRAPVSRDSCTALILSFPISLCIILLECF